MRGYKRRRARRRCASTLKMSGFPYFGHGAIVASFNPLGLDTMRYKDRSYVY